MSTSISYKGQVIASFGNTTKTLNTAGTWLEDDITVTAVDSSAAVTVITQPDSHGGVIKHINAVDLSNDTVDATHLLQGYTAHDRDGNAVTGTYTGDNIPAVQSKTVTPTKSTQNVTPDSNYDYLSSVTVNPIPNQYIIPTGTKTITSNGTSDVTNYASVSVNVPTGSTINNQNKTITPTETQQNVSADSGYTGLGTVTVEAIDSEYIGSDVARRSSTDLTSSGATVTAPAGYYATAATKTITSGTQGTPSVNRTTGTNSVTLTPVVVNSAGYINGGSQTGTAVTITASELVNGTKSITANGTGIDVTNYASVNINVPTGGAINNQNKTVTPTESQQSITADSGYTGLGTVTVNAIANTYVGSEIARKSSTDITTSVSQETGELTVTAPSGYYTTNGSKVIPAAELDSSIASYSWRDGAFTIRNDVSTEGYLSQSIINSIMPNDISGITVITSKSVAPTESTQTAADRGTFVVSNITVDAIPSTYVGSGITQRDDTDLTTSGATVTVPAGYYASQETKSVSTTTHPSPTASINSTNGLITASHTQGTGYVTGGTTTGTLQLSTAAAATITPTTSSQTAVAAGKYTTGAITVAAIPNNYIQTDDATATAADIISGETAYVDGSKVTGTLVVQHYYTGSTAPSSSLGVNGDIYLQA